MARLQPDWEATRTVVQEAVVAALRDFVAAAPGERSLTVEPDGHVVVRHDARTCRWWIDPEPTVNPTNETAAPPWQIEIWVHATQPHAQGLAGRLRNAVAPHSHAAGTIRAGDDDPAGRAAAIVRQEVARQVGP